MKKLLIYLSLIILIIIFSFWGFKNYKKNQIIEEDNSSFIFSDYHSKFELEMSRKEDLDHGYRILKEIGNKKMDIMNKFLSVSKEQIAFMPENIDTLSLVLTKDNNYRYSSSLNLGEPDKEFNAFLVDHLGDYLLENRIQEIRLFTLTPIEIGNIPLPDDILNNIESK